MAYVAVKGGEEAIDNAHRLLAHVRRGDEAVPDLTPDQIHAMGVKQVAAIEALNGPQECIQQIRERYKQRRDVLIEGLHQAGWEVPAPPASMFAWAPLPNAYREIGSLAFSKLLLEKANVAVSPGVGFGEHGEGYVRIAMVENVQRLRQATRNIKQFMSGRNSGGGERREKVMAAPVKE